MEAVELKIPLGRLVAIPVREVWAHEANDFTPWLAKPFNLAFLAETLQFDALELQGTEVPVGNFFIDILARDFENTLVVIENQFGPTDHTHLGQLMTYLAGQDGRTTVVWIAERFREEHRAAIDWLNSSTIDGFNFFGVEVEALRIGASDPALRFNVVAKPNDWSRKVTKATHAAEGPLNERQKAYSGYWSAFGAYLQDQGSSFRKNPWPRDTWCQFAIGRQGFALSATVNLTERKLGVQLYIGHQNARFAFDQLAAERQAIESEFGASLEWQRIVGRTASRIAVYRTDLDPSDEDQRPKQYAWLLDQMNRLSGVFTDRIRTMKLEGDDLVSPPASE